MIKTGKTSGMELSFLEFSREGVDLLFAWDAGGASAEELTDSLALVREDDAGGVLRFVPVPVVETEEQIVRSSKDRADGRCLWFGCRVPHADTAGYRLVWAGSGRFKGMKWSRFKAGRYVALSNAAGGSFAVFDDRIFRMEGTALRVRMATARNLWAARCRLAADMIMHPSVGGFGALAVAVLVRWLRLFHRRPMWLISDRELAADDNGRVFFEYCQALPPYERERREFVFAVSGKVPAHAELSRLGRVVDMTGLRYRLYFLLSEAVISSQHGAAQRRPFDGRLGEWLRPLLARPKFIYLKHGIFKDDMSMTVRRPAMNAKLIVAAANGEYESIRSPSYMYPEGVVQLCGMPRYDRLENRAERAITIMPTWRKRFAARDEEGHLRVNDELEDSTFFRAFTAMFGDESLREACAKFGYELRIMWHPNLRMAADRFHVGAHIRVLPEDYRYADLFSRTDLLITDFSSTAFDFAYLHKPVVYFQPDEEEFFASQYQKGYFDYRRDGFGEVETEVAGLVSLLTDYMSGGCRMKPVYRDRVDRFFAFTDAGNCRRVYEAICRLA